MSFVVLVVLAIIIFMVVSNVMKAMRGAAGAVSSVAQQGERQAMRTLLEKQIESGGDVADLLRAVRAAKGQGSAARGETMVTFSGGKEGGFADSVRAALAVASAAAAEQIVATAPKTKKKKHGASAQIDTTGAHRYGLRPPLDALCPFEPLAPARPHHARPPLTPLSPLAARSARS